ncbi:unnamed protein product, partial [marine sediment metagenome]
QYVWEFEASVYHWASKCLQPLGSSWYRWACCINYYQFDRILLCIGLQLYT